MTSPSRRTRNGCRRGPDGGTGAAGFRGRPPSPTACWLDLARRAQTRCGWRGSRRGGSASRRGGCRPTWPPAPRAAETARRRHGLPERYVLYVGTIDRRKDLGTLLGALGLLDTRVSLVMAGTIIAGRTDLEAEVDRRGLRARVRGLGYVPRGD